MLFAKDTKNDKIVELLQNMDRIKDQKVLKKLKKLLKKHHWKLLIGATNYKKLPGDVLDLRKSKWKKVKADDRLTADCCHCTLKLK